eukprot:1344349-Pyramimonas_sp.AAC.1
MSHEPKNTHSLTLLPEGHTSRARILWVFALTLWSATASGTRHTPLTIHSDQPSRFDGVSADGSMDLLSRVDELVSEELKYSLTFKCQEPRVRVATYEALYKDSHAIVSRGNILRMFHEVLPLTGSVQNANVELGEQMRR